MTITYTGDPVVDAILVRITALQDLARVEGYRYPGGGLGFLSEANALLWLLAHATP